MSCLSCLCNHEPSCALAFRNVQDAQEFLVLLMSTVYESEWSETVRDVLLKRELTLDGGVAVDEYVKAAMQSPRYQRMRLAARHPLLQPRRLDLMRQPLENHNPMEGLQASCYQCRKCGQKYVTNCACCDGCWTGGWDIRRMHRCCSYCCLCVAVAEGCLCPLRYPLQRVWSVSCRMRA